MAGRDTKEAQRPNSKTMEQQMSVQQSQDMVQPPEKQPAANLQGQSAPVVQQSAGTPTGIKPQIRDWASI